MQKTADKVKECFNTSSEKTPEKPPPTEEARTEDSKNNLISSEEECTKSEFVFRTPEKIRHKSLNDSVEDSLNKNKTPEKNKNKTPEKNIEVNNLKSEKSSSEGEEGMISSTEQARLLIAANKTPSKGVNKTPVKGSPLSERKSVEDSPGTPGKHKRVNLITLSSPKAKRIKQI